jgi:hypothetical protein
VNYGASSGPARWRCLRRNWIVLDPVDGLATDASYLRDLTNPVWTACWTPKCRSRLPRAFDPRPAALPRRTRSSAQNSPWECRKLVPGILRRRACRFDDGICSGGAKRSRGLGLRNDM